MTKRLLLTLLGTLFTFAHSPLLSANNILQPTILEVVEREGNATITNHQ